MSCVGEEFARGQHDLDFQATVMDVEARVPEDAQEETALRDAAGSKLDELAEAADDYQAAHPASAKAGSTVEEKLKTGRAVAETIKAVVEAGITIASAVLTKKP